MTEIGQLNRRVYIQKRAGADGGGQPLDNWTAFATVWANVKGQSGKGAIVDGQAGVPASVARFSVRIRQRTDIDDSMRLLVAGVPYDIRLVLQDEETRQWTDLVCELGGNNG